MSPRFLLLGALISAAALPAMAQPSPSAPPAAAAARPGPGPGALFGRVDANGDGRVVFEEVWRFAQARFGEADRNKDGALVLEEALAFQPVPAPEAPPRPEINPMRARMTAAIFRAIDVNSDGRVTLEEIRPALEAQFRALDVNGDRGVTLDEVPMPRHGMQHGGTAMHQRGAMPGGPATAPQPAPIPALPPAPPPTPTR